MARLLEDLESGTPVYIGESRIGDIRGVYAEGSARLAEYLVIHLDERSEDLLIPTKDVAALDSKGVILMGDDATTYADVPAFEAASYPTIRKLR